VLRNPHITTIQSQTMWRWLIFIRPLHAYLFPYRMGTNERTYSYFNADKHIRVKRQFTDLITLTDNS
jgi:hypothetical protein